MNWYKTAQLEIPPSCQGGDCFEAAGRYFMDNAVFPYQREGIVLVHGEVTGQGPIEGLKYGHAWIEEGDTVIDMSRGRNVKMPKILYYALGNIEEEKTFRYTPQEFRKKIIETEHWGPWDLKTEF